MREVQAFNLLHRVQRINRSRRRLLLEALLSLLAVRPVLRIVPFKILAAWFTRPVRGLELNSPARALLCEDVRWAITRAAALLPGQTVCFPRAIAAQFLLRWRGVSTDLYYGACLMPETGLKTHVWLQDGEQGIVGHQEAAGFHILACYSSRRIDSPSLF